MPASDADRLPLERPPVLLPAVSAGLVPRHLRFNIAVERRAVEVCLWEPVPFEGRSRLSKPDGWQIQRTVDGFSVTPPSNPAPGRYALALSIEERAASTLTLIDQPHVTPRVRSKPAALSAHVMDVRLPSSRIGNVGGGNDRVAQDLASIGLVLQAVDDARLSTAAGLDDLDTLLVGLFAMRTRPALAAAMPRIHRWIESGGHLVTLYHRPWDDWDAERTPPRRLEIGQPSLRWRVTDERAADLGAGRHVHTSLILHHQMAKGVSGAFRLMANLLA